MKLAVGGRGKEAPNEGVPIATIKEDKTRRICGRCRGPGSEKAQPASILCPFMLLVCTLPQLNWLGMRQVKETTLGKSKKVEVAQGQSGACCHLEPLDRRSSESETRKKRRGRAGEGTRKRNKIRTDKGREGTASQRMETSHQQETPGDGIDLSEQ